MSNRKKKLIKLGLFYLFVAGFFVLFNPDQLPLIFLLLPFILIFLTLYVTIVLVLRTFFSLRKRSEQLIAGSISIMPTLLLVIQSITQLTIRDVLLAISIVVVAVWYISKTSTS